MAEQTIRSLADTLTSEQSPSANYTQRTTLMVRDTSGRRMFVYVAVRGLSGRSGAIVTSAKLRLYASRSRGSVSYTIRRASGPWTPSSLRWNNQPSGGTTVRTFSTGLTANRAVDIDVTSALTAWLTSGVTNYGFRIETTSTDVGGSSFHSMNASGSNAKYRPVLLLDVSYPPEVPTSLSPANGAQVSTADPLVTWRYAGEGAEKMVSYQLQTATSSSGFTIPTSDTGEVASSEPQHQLTGQSGEVFYRVRHKAADGRWSPWSSPTSFGVTAKMSVTITSTELVTDDPSPSTTWTVTGTQTSFRVLLRRVTPPSILADSGIIAGSDLQWAPPKPIKVPNSTQITREVRVYDDVERVATPGSPIYAVATSGPFTIEPATEVVQVTDLVASKTPASPAVTLTWSRPTTPDSYLIERSIDGGPWSRFVVEVGDVATGGTSYLWRDVTAPAEHDLTYRVRPVVNLSMGLAPAEVSIRLRMSFIWLADPNDPDWVLPLAGNDAGTWTLGEDSSVINVLGSDRSNLVHEGFRGYEGTVSGEFVSDIHELGDVSAQELRDRAWRTKTQPTALWRLAIGDMNIPVVVRNVNPVPKAGSQVRFGVSLDFMQQGELPWEDDA